MVGLTALLPEKMPWLNVFLGKMPRDAGICDDQKVLSSSEAELPISSEPARHLVPSVIKWCQCGRSYTDGEYWWIIVAQSG